MIQANEVLKIIVGYGEPLVGRLLTFDAQSTRFGEFKIKRDPSCPTCGGISADGKSDSKASVLAAEGASS